MERRSGQERTMCALYWTVRAYSGEAAEWSGTHGWRGEAAGHAIDSTFNSHCQSTPSHGFGRELSGSRHVVVFHHFNVNGLPSRAD